MQVPLEQFQYSNCFGNSYENKNGEKYPARANIPYTCVLPSFIYVIEIDVCLLQMQVCPQVIHLVVYIYVNINP